MRKTCLVLAVATVFATGVLQVRAQGPSQQWKEKHANGERYEGIGFNRNVTTVGLEMIAFMALSNPDTRAAIDIARDDEIVVDFYSRTATPYLLAARELDLSEYYWMEPKQRRPAVLGQNTFQGIWKTDVLRKLKSDGSRVSVPGLGVLVWFNKGDDDVAHVAPAVMRASGAKPLQTITGYKATFLPDVLFDRVSYTVRGGCQVSDTSKVLVVGGSVGKKYPATSFPVEFTLPAGYSGQAMLEITAMRSASAPEKVDKSWYCFTHFPGAR